MLSDREATVSGTLRGKTAIVTGASRGIGRAAALTLAAAGANIAAIYAKNREEAEAVCTACEGEFHVKARAYACDVASFAETKQTVSQISEDFTAFHMLVNNAGIARDGLAAVMREADFDAVVDTNLKGSFHMIRHCLPHFLRIREGSIVNVSSIVGLVGNIGQCNYAASKAGVIGMTKAVAREYASRGIRCNAVAPGFISTEMTQKMESDELIRQIPLGKMGTPEDVAKAVLYLLTADYVTGAVLQVDGGIAM